MMRDRVFAAKDKSELFLKLSRTKQKDSDTWLFDNNKDLFLFAVAIGFKHEKREPLEKRDTEIPLSVFQKSKDNLDFIDLIALGATENVYILDWDDEGKVEEKLTIVEEYANWGLRYMNEKILNSSSGLYDNLLQIINKEFENNVNGSDGLPDDLDNIVSLIV